MVSVSLSLEIDSHDKRFQYLNPKKKKKSSNWRAAELHLKIPLNLL